MLKSIKYILAGLMVTVFMVGCGGAKPQTKGKVTQAINPNAKTVYVSSKATFTGKIAQNIKDECKIDSQVMEWLQKYAVKKNINIVMNSKPKATDLVLKISITDAISQRMGPMGHNKNVIISGKLYKGKKLISSFKAARRSGGGYFGGYRSSCSVLGSCAKTLGKDTAGWLVNPTNNAILGDVYLIQ